MGYFCLHVPFFCDSTLLTFSTLMDSQEGCAKGGGVRFSEEPPSAGAASHVHFEEKLHDSVVMVTPEEDGHFMVKVRSGLALLRVAESAVRDPMSQGDFAHILLKALYVWAHDTASTVPSLILDGGGVSMEIIRGQCRETKEEVGFLKTQHRYEIVFTLPEVPALGKYVCPAPVPSPHLRITDITPAPEGGLKVTCEYLAQQEGVLCEEVLLLSETEDVCVKVKVHARVMDRHHGTPMLLDGVRCIGVELEYDSEQSDWQGFD
ncbi:hypothetical protein D4764_03G0004340 [Takifugu flavidus]|uniref:Uncharacterized protein n=1 Tax=Takifugu flavidus TaxID=433684 RepID=A0A5C6N7S6_9TELE|nr:hypothetical protein D4764_03G0004340 [Takifugu flavidus]